MSVRLSASLPLFFFHSLQGTLALRTKYNSSFCGSFKLCAVTMPSSLVSVSCSSSFRLRGFLVYGHLYFEFPAPTNSTRCRSWKSSPLVYLIPLGLEVTHARALLAKNGNSRDFAMLKAGIRAQEPEFVREKNVRFVNSYFHVPGAIVIVIYVTTASLEGALRKCWRRASGEYVSTARRLRQLVSLAYKCRDVAGKRESSFRTSGAMTPVFKSGKTRPLTLPKACGAAASWRTRR